MAEGNEAAGQAVTNTAITIPRLPRRAWNLARRVLQMERELNGRGRVTFEIVMIDEAWLLTVSKPVKWENLEE